MIYLSWGILLWDHRVCSRKIFRGWSWELELTHAMFPATHWTCHHGAPSVLFLSSFVTFDLSFYWPVGLLLCEWERSDSERPWWEMVSVTHCYNPIICNPIFFGPAQNTSSCFLALIRKEPIIDKYTLLCLKQAHNKDLLYSTRNSDQYSVVT